MGTVVLTMVVVGVAVLLVWMVARWQSLRVLDAELEEHAGRMAFLAEPRPHPPDFGLGRDPGRGPRPEHLPPAFQSGTGWLFVQVIDARDGSEVFRSPSLSSTDVPLAPLMQDAPLGRPVWRQLGDRRVRALRVEHQVSSRWNGVPSDRPAPLPPEPPGAQAAQRLLCGYVAIDAGVALAELGRLAWTLVAVWGTASLLAVAAAWWLRRSVIGPINRLNAGIQAIDPERLGGRVSDDVPVEMAETTRLLNDLLDRLAAVMVREKATIANIAHELRSPISGLRTTLEVAGLDAASPEGTLASRCLPTVVAMHAMVVNLLALARLEAGQERVVWSAVDPGALIAACWVSLQAVAEERGMRLVVTGSAAPSRSCPDKLRMVIGNLLDNAVTHAPAGTVIDCVCAIDGSSVQVRISNRIEGPAPDPQRLFEPFWRGDSARSSPRHCGLGLALARRIVALLAGDLAVTVADGSFTATLTLPSATAVGTEVVGRRSMS